MSKTDMLKLLMIAGVSTSVIISHPITINKQVHNKILQQTHKIKREKILLGDNKKKLEQTRLLEKKKKEEQKKLEKQKREEKKWISVRLSFYTNDIMDCGKTDAISASGKNLIQGSNLGNKYVASPKNIPFGTKIYIKNYGVYEVADRGGAITYRNGVMMLDVFIPNASQEYLNELGVKYSKAQILDK